MIDQIDLSETYSSTSDRKSADVERGVQKLELTEKRRVHLRAGSEINLTSAGKHNKRTSFRQSLAVCTERAQVGPVWVYVLGIFVHTSMQQKCAAPWSSCFFPGTSLLVQAGFLNPLLRRTASAKTSLRRAPSSLFIEHGKVFQRRKVSERSISSPSPVIVKMSLQCDLRCFLTGPMITCLNALPE